MRRWVQNYLVGPKESLRKVMKIITHSPAGIAVVVDAKKRMKGYVQDGDVRRALLRGANLAAPIEKIMNPNPFFLPYGLTREEQRAELKKHKRLRAPVIDKEGRVCDVVCYWDLPETGGGDDWHVNHATKKSRERIQLPEVLVVGGAGYIGSILCRILLERGYKVRVLDKLMYGEASIRDLKKHENFRLIQGDILQTDVAVNAVFGVDAVVNLAAIVGDAACDIDASRTIMVNYISAKMLADICKHLRVGRYIFASTCSIYGSSRGKKMMSENSPLKPITLYAETKLKTEWGILELASENFSPCILRLATVYGLSPRPRFDLIVNLFTAMAVKNKKITVFGGDQYRPNVHVYDAARAFAACIEAPITKIHKQIFNVGSTEQNCRISELAEKIVRIIPGTETLQKTNEKDARDYHVSFGKIKRVLGFKCVKTVEDGIREIRDALTAGEIGDYKDTVYSNLESVGSEVFV